MQHQWSQHCGSPPCHAEFISASHLISSHLISVMLNLFQHLFNSTALVSTFLHSSQPQSVNPRSFATFKVTFTTSCLQAPKPLQCSFRWYFVAFLLLQIYTSSAPFEDSKNGNNKTKTIFFINMNFLKQLKSKPNRKMIRHFPSRLQTIKLFIKVNHTLLNYSLLFLVIKNVVKRIC